MHSIRSLNDLDLSLHQFVDDKAERRAGIERRQFSYSVYIPERRSGQERRREQDRSEFNRSQ
jgi:hypothetical protein